MFSNFLIGLREGLEAALVVGIIVAYLVRTDRRDRLAPVWAGVAVAIALSLGVGALLTFTSHALSFQAQELFGGLMSIIAVGFVTWMVFWMRATSHAMRDELHGKVEHAVTMGGAALALAAFLAVGREGLETALFLWPTMQSGGAGAPFGAVAGLVTAVVIGYLIYRRSVRLNLARFFRYTGLGLIVVAAGVLSYGVHDLQEADFLPGMQRIAFDMREHIPPTSWYGTLLKGTVNFNPESTWLQVVVWAAYLGPVLTLFLRPVRARRTGRATERSLVGAPTP